MKIKIVSTEVIFNNPKDKLKFSQADKKNYDDEANLDKKYKRNLEYSSSSSSKLVLNSLKFLKEFKAKKISQEEPKTYDETVTV
jgi:hypothetical protein